MKNKKFEVVSFFAGVGGIEYGFEKTGLFKTIWANEVDKSATITYKMNFHHTLIERDIKDVEVDEVPNADIFVGGFPCQAFSIAGYQLGFEDERGNLFFEMLRIIKEKKPRVVFLENVRNLLTHDKGKTFTVIKSALEKNGYVVKNTILNAKDFGNTPQNRERIYIIAFREDKDAITFDLSNLQPIPLTKNVISILDESVKESYYYTEEKTIIYKRLVDYIKDENVAYQWRRQYVRVNKSGVFPTLTANMGTGGHNVPIIYQNNRIRKLTPRECFRVQGYEDSYQLPENLPDSQLYKQAGNSVVVPVIERIALLIYKTLESSEK